MNKRMQLIRPEDREGADISRGGERDPDAGTATPGERRGANRLDAGSSGNAVAELYRLSQPGSRFRPVITFRKVE